MRRPSRERTRTTAKVLLDINKITVDLNTPCEWMAHDTQYAILIYSLGIEYSLHPVEVTKKLEKWIE